MQPLRCLRDCSGCFRLERLPGGSYTHWKAPPFHGAHPNRTLGRVFHSLQTQFDWGLCCCARSGMNEKGAPSSAPFHPPYGTMF